MGAATFIQHSFLGGEWSFSVQGRIDRPDYRTALNLSYNMLPIEQGALVRRPGTRWAQTTRGGTFGRELKFEFEALAPYRIEFTDSHIRFRVGHLLVPQLQQQQVVSQTGGPPLELTLDSMPTDIPFSPLDDVYFPAAGDARVSNRMFRIAGFGSNFVALYDPITGMNIDPTINFVGQTMYRALDIASPYTAANIPTVRLVQAEERAILLCGNVVPTVLEATTLPPPGLDANGQPIPAIFSFLRVTFLDGPYLDPVMTGTTLTLAPGSPLSGLVQIQQNGTAGPVFSANDLGRQIRLFSEPPAWSPASPSYPPGAVVSYPSGVNGGVTYWQSLVGSNAVTPGTDPTKWAINPNGAVWTWGTIVAQAGTVTPTTGTPFSGPVDPTFGLVIGNPAAAFDGNVNKPAALCAGNGIGTSGLIVDGFLGLDQAGAGGTPQGITSAIVYPSSDIGFVNALFHFTGGGAPEVLGPAVTMNLWGAGALPTTPGAGTLLGSISLSHAQAVGGAPVTIPVSPANSTAFRYIWIEISSVITSGGAPSGFIQHQVQIGQVVFAAVGGGGISNTSVYVQLGPGAPALLYLNPAQIETWQLGAFSNSTSYPTCGVYHEGRVWFSGAVGNRVDASQSNGVLPNGQINMAPTNPDGSVTDNCGISYTFNADDVNPIFWMHSDQTGIICGTQGGEWLIQASNLNNPISPTNMQAKRFSKYRCANIEPRRAGGPLIVTQYYQQKLLEFFPDVFSGRLNAQNIGWKSPHLTAQKIEELAFMLERAPIVWARRGDFRLIGITYKRENLMSSQEPNFAAAHQHELGSGNAVTGICEASNVDGSLSTVSLVTLNTQGIYQVELLTDLFLETDNPANAWFVDSGIIPQVFPFTTPQPGFPYGGVQLTGLWPFSGTTLSVYAGGLDCGDYPVEGGAVYVPFGDGVSAGTANGQFTRSFLATNPQIVVGYTYLSQAQIVRPMLPAEAGARIGPALGKKRRVSKYSVMAANTAGLFIGTTVGNLYPVSFKSPANVALQTGKFFTGIYHDTLADNYTYDGMMLWELVRPFPAIISAVEAFLQTQDE